MIQESFLASCQKTPQVKIQLLVVVLLHWGGYYKAFSGLETQSIEMRLPRILADARKDSSVAKNIAAKVAAFLLCFLLYAV